MEFPKGKEAVETARRDKEGGPLAGVHLGRDIGDESSAEGIHENQGLTQIFCINLDSFSSN